VPPHQPYQNYDVTIHPVIGFGEFKIGRIGQSMAADRFYVSFLIVQFSLAIDVHKLVIKDSLHRIGVVHANSFDAYLL